MRRLLISTFIISFLLGLNAQAIANTDLIKVRGEIISINEEAMTIRFRPKKQNQDIVLNIDPTLLAQIKYTRDCFTYIRIYYRKIYDRFVVKKIPTISNVVRSDEQPVPLEESRPARPNAKFTWKEGRWKKVSASDVACWKWMPGHYTKVGSE